MSEEKKGNNSKLFVVIAVVVLVVGAIAAGFFYMDKMKKADKQPVVTSNVGAIDRDKIYELPEFVDAQKKMEEYGKSIQAKIETETKGLNKNDPKDIAKIQEILSKYEREVSVQENTIKNPLMKRAEAAIATIAVKKGLNTILDKKIVVCGTQDITNDVVEFMKANKTITPPTDKEIDALTAKSKVGYFDQSVVMSLKDFRTAREEMEKIKEAARQAFEQEVKTKKLTQEQAGQLQMSYMDDLKKKSDDLHAPIFRKVNRTVETVAKTKGLSIVVDKENILYGGINITSEVADEMK
ncbi:MAG: OmpH family outer membrane protein [Firmicutes bacterium]|nr:OmpH family outer membrane protein [Bacillota bacterium]